jgi:Zn-dependent protease with chaperone function
MELRANYYAGIRPIPINATVYLLNDKIEIRYNKEDENVHREWEIKKIEPDQNERDGKFILKYGTKHPFEFLEFENNEALNYLMQHYPQKKWQRPASLFTRNPVMSVVIIVGLFIVAILSSYFLLVPKVSDLVSKTVPVSWEVELGDKLGAGMISEQKKDVNKSRMLDSFFIMLDVRTEYPIRFHFINDSVINAFAMPGGNIVIYKGLFDKINSYESLAGLMGHEFTHVEFKHSLKTIFRSISSFIILAAFFGDLTGLAGIIAENANTIQNLSYSRDFEREADANAVTILLDRKISLSGMLDLFNVFLSESKAGESIPKFLNTHPVTDDRIQYIKSIMGEKESDVVHYANLLELFNRLKAI